MNRQELLQEAEIKRQHEAKAYLFTLTFILSIISAIGFYWVSQKAALQIYGEQTNAIFTDIAYERSRNIVHKFAVFQYTTTRGETFMHHIHERYVDLSMPRGTTIPILYRYTDNGIEASTDDFIGLYLGGLLAGIIPLLILIWVWHLHLKDFKKRGLIKDPLKENVLDLK